MFTYGWLRMSLLHSPKQVVTTVLKLCFMGCEPGWEQTSLPHETIHRLDPHQWEYQDLRTPDLSHAAAAATASLVGISMATEVFYESSVAGFRRERDRTCSRNNDLSKTYVTKPIADQKLDSWD